MCLAAEEQLERSASALMPYLRASVKHLVAHCLKQDNGLDGPQSGGPEGFSYILNDKLIACLMKDSIMVCSLGQETE